MTQIHFDIKNEFHIFYNAKQHLFAITFFRMIGLVSQ